MSQWRSEKVATGGESKARLNTKRNRCMPILISPLREVSGVSANAPSVSRREPAFARGHSSGRLLVSCFAIVSLVVASALGAERITPIQEGLRDNDGNFVPDRLGETFTLSGILS